MPVVIQLDWNLDPDLGLFLPSSVASPDWLARAEMVIISVIQTLYLFKDPANTYES